ncbi:pyridoxal-phosphate dependent enzyme [Alteromonas sediminis]|uniref:Pyridoxal-phosphate dependent enzyme n=1 Tax=Alteromonas sediminis TaxID=2259342 RepID=A0A3N5Y482_9ALTE|nr:pyridoxal-phosphate dependent enzyme [Alteromonas sediminis]RPJ67893.1 pyridoxal-phosphate dependent enzyme [Alteromonas sediminis]
MSFTSIPAALPSPLTPFSLDDWPHDAPCVWVKRDDLIHPYISGNKWRKLAYTNIEKAHHVMSIGGGYSNHLHALGYKCATSGVPFTALIRGNYADSLTPMLIDLQSWGCQIHFLSKAQYAQRESSTFASWRESVFGPHTYIPEGGSTRLAVLGVLDMMKEISMLTKLHARNLPTHFVAPVASGATLAGMIKGSNQSQYVLGIAVLKGQNYLEDQVQRFIDTGDTNWRITHDFVHKGYAKSSPELLAFCNKVNSTTDISVEPVYSGKAFYALDQLIKQKHFKQSDNIVIVHTGGLQGARVNSNQK